ncbi:MAG: cell division protein FtsL [Candidatus Methylomirabilia bacterium]
MSPRSRSGSPVRERDRRRLRTMGLAMGLSACVVVGVLGVVALEIHSVQLSYRLEELRAARGELEELNRQLRVELATLGSLRRIELKARAELGMGPPAPDQLRLAREFVVPGSAPQTAWEVSALGVPRVP